MEDGSVLLVHSSPPGVQISGTPTPNGDLSSQAILLANSIMPERYPAWSENIQTIRSIYLICKVMTNFVGILRS